MVLLVLLHREMEDWLVKAEGTWVLAEGFNNFLGKVMHDEVGILNAILNLFFVDFYSFNLSFLQYIKHIIPDAIFRTNFL